MLKIVNNELQLNLFKNFTALQDVHLYHSPRTKSSIFFSLSVSKALAQNQLVFHGTKFWPELNDNLKHLTMICFKKQFKKSFSEVY